MQLLATSRADGLTRGTKLRQKRGRSLLSVGLAASLPSLSVAMLVSGTASAAALGRTGSGHPEAAQACQSYHLVAVARDQGHASVAIVNAAADARIAARSERRWSPLAEALSSLGRMPDAMFTRAERAATAADERVIATACSAIGVSGDAIRSPRFATPDPLDGNTATAYQYFITQTSLTPVQVAGLEGNLLYESGGSLNPAQVQFGCPLPPGPCGVGIAQWTDPGSRFSALEALAASEHVTWSILGVQLQFVWQELTGTYAGAGNSLKACTTTSCSTTVVEDDYEIPGDPSASYAERLANADEILAAYQGSAPAAVSVAVGPSGTTELAYEGTDNTLWEAYTTTAGSTQYFFNELQDGAGHAAVHSNPSIAISPSGNTEIAYEGVGDRLYEAYTTTAGSTEYFFNYLQDGAGNAAVYSPPSIDIAPSGNTEIGYEGAASRLYEAYTTTAGSTHYLLNYLQDGAGNAAVYSAPSVAISPSGTTEVAYEGAGHRLYEAYTTTAGSTEYLFNYLQDGTGNEAVYSAPTVAIARSGNIEIAYEGVGNRLYEAYTTTEGSTHYLFDYLQDGVGNAGVHATPSIAISASGSTEIAYEGAGDRLYEAYTTTAASTEYLFNYLQDGAGSDAVDSAPSVASAPSGNTEIGYEGQGNTLWEAYTTTAGSSHYLFSELRDGGTD